MESRPKYHKTKIALTILAIPIILLAYNTISYQYYDFTIFQPVNLNYPIQNKGQVINQRFTVKEPHLYSFLLEFKYHKDDFEHRQKLYDLLGTEELDWSNQKVHPGVIIPVRLIIISHLNGQDQVLNNQVYDDHDRYNERFGSFTREIDRAKLDIGEHTVIVENHRQIHDFDDFEVRFTVEKTYTGK